MTTTNTIAPIATSAEALAIYDKIRAEFMSAPAEHSLSALITNEVREINGYVLVKFRNVRNYGNKYHFRAYKNNQRVGTFGSLRNAIETLAS